MRRKSAGGNGGKWQEWPWWRGCPDEWRLRMLGYIGLWAALWTGRGETNPCVLPQLRSSKEYVVNVYIFGALAFSATAGMA